jgi:YHS domain-containing protein
MGKFLFFAAAVFFLWKMFQGDANKRKQETKKEHEILIAKGEMVKDPVCGSYVSLDNSVQARDGDKILHFCSYECRDKYLKQVESSKNSEG